MTATEHKNGVHDNPGSDFFKWALCICIGYECMEKEDYRNHHGTVTPWEDLKKWIINE